MNENFGELKKIIQKEKTIVQEIKILLKELRKELSHEERKLAISQIFSLKEHLKNFNSRTAEILKQTGIPKSLEKREIEETKKELQKKDFTKMTSRAKPEEFELSEIEKLTLNRLRKRKKAEKEKKEIKPSRYVQISNKIFSRISTDLSKESFFKSMKRNLIKTNFEVLPSSYISVMLFTSIIVGILSFFVFVFFLFFNFETQIPFIFLSEESFGARFAKTFWIPIIFPLLSFAVLYFYPSTEKKSLSSLINQELPFATIHMSAISGAMIEPTRIFRILIITGDYPNISKQFIKLLNLINLQGFSLVNALRATAFNCPSEKLAELLNGLATTITSGGNLQVFFEKRAETLFIDYRLEKEKYAKNAETFMDIYISVVIAAPMILMLLLVMMKISGIGLNFSTGTIGLIMALGVSLINFVFLIFLNIKEEASE